MAMYPVEIADPPESTERGSAYPAEFDELLPQARILAKRLGEIPSRNRLMGDLKIGAPKAKIVRTALLAEAQSDAAEPDPDPVEPTGSEAPAEPVTQEADKLQATDNGHPGTEPAPTSAADARPSMPPMRSWPLLVLALPAFVAIWSGWVGLGGLTGFGVVHPLPGIADNVAINSAITLPIGMETYAAYAMRAWLSGADIPARARRFAMWSGVGSLVLGAAGQVAYHLMSAAGMTHAPWPITTAVSCLPIAVVGMGVALASLLRGGFSTR